MSTNAITTSAWIVGEYVDQPKSACPHCCTVPLHLDVDTRINLETGLRSHLIDGQWVACPISRSWTHKPPKAEG